MCDHGPATPRGGRATCSSSIINVRLMQSGPCIMQALPARVAFLRELQDAMCDAVCCVQVLA